MKKVLLLSILLFVPLLLTGCESSEEKSACKKVLVETYAKANDPTITKCIADYDIQEKRVVYNFCINTAETIYTLNSNGSLLTVKKEDSTYYFTASLYKQIETEVLEKNDRFYAFEFKGNELK